MCAILIHQTIEGSNSFEKSGDPKGLRFSVAGNSNSEKAHARLIRLLYYSMTSHK